MVYATPHPVLLLAARARAHDRWRPHFVAAADDVHDWPDLVNSACDHGLGPLLHEHITQCGVRVPDEAMARLRGVRAFHRRANATRSAVTAEILTALGAAGIEALVLKGAALAQTVYPEPGLRPMRDTDLLVRNAGAPRAQEILLGLGFAVAPEQAHFHDGLHQLPAVKREQNGLTVSVEVHRTLGVARHRSARTTFEVLAPSARSLTVGGVEAKMLGALDLLFHVYRHGFAGALVSEPLRLIWAADVVSVVEAFVDEIPWELAARLYPEICHALPLFDPLSPWSEKVIAKIPLALRPALGGVGADYRGWPRPRGELPVRDWLVETFRPPPWWLHVHYGEPYGAVPALRSRARHFGQLLRRSAKVALAAARQS
jgi:hypothetical protein